MTRDISTSNNAIVGSNLRLDALLSKIEVGLKDVLLGLKQAAADYRACSDNEQKSEQMRHVFNTTNSLFNEILDSYRQTKNITSSITRVARGDLPTKGLDREILSGRIRIDATDEGFSESLAAIASLPNPEERMSATLPLIRELAHSVECAENRVSALVKRLSYNGEGVKNANANEAASSKSLLDSSKLRIPILKARLDTTLEVFFKSRAEYLKGVSDVVYCSTRELANILPDGSESTQKYARIYVATNCTDAISAFESNFRNPNCLHSRTGRIIYKRRRSA